MNLRPDVAPRPIDALRFVGRKGRGVPIGVAGRGRPAFLLVASVDSALQAIRKMRTPRSWWVCWDSAR